MAKMKIYPITGTTPSFQELIEHMYKYLSENSEMETQLIKNENGSCIIQSRARDGKVMRFVGMDKAVTLYFVNGQNIVNVTIGEAKWLDKGLGLAIAWFICWLTAVSTAVGLYSQYKLLRKLEKEMDTFMGSSPKETGTPAKNAS